MTGSSRTASRHTAYLRSLFFFTSLLSTTYTRATITEAPAWHGQVTPGSDTTQSNRVPFTPYWVPFGSTSIDDDSPTIAYSPADAWSVKHGSGYIGPGAHTTDTPGAQLEYRFTGTGIEWYGSKGPTYGLADVSLDGRKPETVDLYAETEVHQQMLFYTDRLPTPTDEDDNADSAHAEHAIRIVALDAGNGKQRRHLNVDAFVVQGTGAQKSASRARKNRRTPLPVAVRPRPLSQDRMTTTDRQRMQRVRRLPPANTPPERRAWSGATRLVERGTTGINAMQFAVISDTQAIVIDKVEHNLLSVNGHPAWGAIYDFASHRVTAPLDLASNSFCAGGSWLGNGTLVNVGGNPVASDHTGAADFGDVNGLQAVRLFEPDQCQRDGDGCTMFEEPKRVRMAGARWYASVARLSDGSALIMGGSTKGGWINNQTTNNPSIEFFPPKAIHGSNGLPIHSSFLAETLNANLFPIIFALPDDRLFVAANRRAMIYSWRDNTEQELPGIPNGIRITYPMTAGSALLPLTPENGYTPEVLICGGSNVDDTRPADEISSQEPASDQCIRMVLDRAGIERGWQVEHMPQARIMPDLVLLPGGEILIVNGAETGVAGYGNVKDQAGQSNADNPAYTPVLYDPSTSSFSSEGMPTSKIARMYHSVASLLPSGEVLLAGSNPNLDRTTASFPTEYRVETLAPPYVHQDRPTLAEVPDRMLYGKPFQVSVELPSGTKLKDVKVSLIDLGFVTHSVHMNTRLVGLKPSALSPDSKTLTIIGPPTPQIYPPGPGWLYVLVSGVPSEGRKVMVGDRASPPVDQAAIDNMLASTQTLAKDPKPKKQNKVADNRMKRVLRRR